jgi:hypothetical protein
LQNVKKRERKQETPHHTQMIGEAALTTCAYMTKYSANPGREEEAI